MNAWFAQAADCPLVVLALLAGAARRSSSDKQKKLYRWVDKNGQVHYGDSVPAEYAEQDREVLNRQGVPVGREEGIDHAGRSRGARRPPTRPRATSRSASSATACCCRPTSRCRSSRSCATTASTSSTRSSRSREQSLSNLRAQRAQIERRPRATRRPTATADAQPLPDERRRRTRALGQRHATQEANLERRREERENIRQTFEADIKRYKELRAFKLTQARRLSR